jgi:hypothetical protein
MIRFFIERKRIEAKGNRFCQCAHDGGTIASSKYQAIALQAIDTKWETNLVITVAFSHFADGTHEAVAGKLNDVFLERCGYSVNDICGSMISDVAAAGVADRFNVSKDKCNMHQFDKLPEAAIGNLVRTKDKQVVNPFEEGQAHIKYVVDCANHFSRSKETE